MDWPGGAVHSRAMAMGVATWLGALTRQIGRHTVSTIPFGKPSVFPLPLLVALPDRASLATYEAQNQVTVEDVGGGAVRLRYTDWPIRYLYVDPAPDTYAALFRRELLGRELPGQADAALPGLAIDHVHPRQQALRNGLRLVLVLPCDRRLNSSWGGGVEKWISYDREKTPRVLLADYLNLAKMAGVPPPSFAAGANLRAEALLLATRLARAFPEEKFIPDMIQAYLEAERARQTGGVFSVSVRG